jgi:hypothetical protein
MTVLKLIDRLSIAERRRNVPAMNCHDSRKRRFLFRTVCARSTYAIRLPTWTIPLDRRANLTRKVIDIDLETIVTAV